MNPNFPRLLAFGALLFAGFALGVVCTGGPSSSPVAQPAVQDWTCSMHPQIHQAEPGACAICGMDLVPSGPSQSTGPPTQVVLSERAKALARLRTVTVQRQADATAEVQLLGRIEPDESTRKSITSWVSGRIDRLHVNTTGEEIRRKQVIATLYSKEVYGAHQDLLTAAAQVERLTSDNARGAATATLAAARERLALLGVPPDELARMEQADQPTRALAIRSPFAGTVIERVATEGAYVETGAPLYRIADLSKVWVQLDAYERDLANLAVGQAVSLLVPNLDDPVAGTVSFIDPSLHPTRRTARVRVAISTPDNTLRPGLFVRATVSTRQADRAGSPLVIPDTAPLFTGKRSIVYVEVPTPTGTAYAPRPVRLGPKLGAFYPVVAGLTEGERVVSRGAFAIDADLQIQGGPSMMTHDDHAPVAQAAPVAGLSKAERRPLVPIVQGYLDVQRALAADDLPTAVSAAEQLEAPILAAVFAGDAQQAWQARVDLLRSNALAVKRANSLEDARGAFEPLSADVEHLLRTFGNPLDQSVHLAHCPMANSNQGATWIQQGDTVDNAYFGAMMRTCGDLLADVPPGGFLPADVRSPTSDHAGHDH